MYRARAGDIFSVPITRTEFLSGRVLLDVESQCIAPRRVKPHSQLAFFNGTMLAEIHGTPMPAPGIADQRILFSSIFLPASGFTSGRWQVIGHKPVDPTQVDFPAALTLIGGPRPHLTWGELALPIAISVAELERLDISPTLHTSELDQMCLVALGRESEVDRSRYRNLDVLRLDHSDLRFSPAGPDLFTRAGLPAQPRYFDEALARGFDTRRFYAPDPRAPFLVCPYCWSVRTPEAICWACGEDTTRDAAIETTQAELDTIARRPCPACGTMIPELALRCPRCRAVQPD